jgi:hypothetical protein
MGVRSISHEYLSFLGHLPRVENDTLKMLNGLEKMNSGISVSPLCSVRNLTHDHCKTRVIRTERCTMRKDATN